MRHRLLAAAFATFAAVAAPTRAADLGIVINDTAHTRLASTSAFGVVLLDCTNACTTPNPPIYDQGTNDHPTIVSNIIKYTLNAVGANGRHVTLYSVIGQRPNLEAWLATPLANGVLRARARGIRVVVDTKGTGSATQCPEPVNAQRQLLRANGVAFVFATGNQSRNGVCSSTAAVSQCEPNSYNVAGTGYDMMCPGGSSRPGAETDPLFNGSNFLAGHTQFGGSVVASDWGGAPGASTVGTSWSAPGVGAGFLALAAQRSHALNGGSLVDESKAALDARGGTSTFAGASFKELSPATIAASVNSHCAASITYPEDGFYLDPDHPGNGIHLTTKRSGTFPQYLYWYTYRADGTPVWYYAQKDRWDLGRTSPRTWFSDVPLTEYRWSGGQRVATTVGYVSVDFCQPSSLTLRWSLGGTTGTEPMVRFRFGGGTRPWERRTISGLWYDPALPGAGYSVESSGTTDYIIYYHFADDGRAVWATTTLNVATVRTAYYGSFDTFASTALCPGCTNLEGSYTPYNAVGSLRVEIGGSGDPVRMFPGVSTATPLNIHWPRAAQPGSPDGRVDPI